MYVASDIHTETEPTLFDRWRRRGDERAHAELVSRHMPLVRQLARRYAYTSEPLEDLVQVAVSALQATLGRSPTISEIAERIGASSEQVIEAMEARLAYRVESLDAPAQPNDEREQWRTAGEIDGGFATAEQSAFLSRALKALPDRERALVRLRFEEDLSQSEIGRKLGISQMHVSRLLRRALTRMQAVAGETG